MRILDDWVGHKETAEELGIKPRTLTSWTHKPDGIPHTKLGNRTIYHRPTVRRWLEERMRRPNQRREA